jgi:hypothetical protein
MWPGDVAKWKVFINLIELGFSSVLVHFYLFFKISHTSKRFNLKVSTKTMVQSIVLLCVTRFWSGPPMTSTIYQQKYGDWSSNSPKLRHFIGTLPFIFLSSPQNFIFTLNLRSKINSKLNSKFSFDTQHFVSLLPSISHLLGNLQFNSNHHHLNTIFNSIHCFFHHHLHW